MITRLILLGTAIAGLAGCVTKPSPECQCSKVPRVYSEILPGEGLKVPDSTTLEIKPECIYGDLTLIGALNGEPVWINKEGRPVFKNPSIVYAQ